MPGDDETLWTIQRIIDDSAAAAGPAMARNFVSDDWRMTAREFVEFWSEGRMAAISTVSPTGDVHSAPLDPRFSGGRFYVPTFANAARMRDHRANPRCSITSWDGPYRAVIVYGDARIATDGQEAPAGGLITVEVTPVRIYAIRPPAGHHSTR